MATTIGVKIELEGAPQYQQNMKALTQQTKLYETQMKNVEKQLKSGASAFQKSMTESKALEQQLQAQKAQLQGLEGAISDATQKYGENSTQVMRLKTQYEELSGKIAETQQQIKEHGGVIGAVGEQLQAVGDKMQEVGDKMSKVGDTLTKRLTLPIAGVATAAVKTTADFDAEMSKVKAISGSTGEEFDALRAKAREMGAQTKFSATEASEAMEYMAMAGWKTDDMLNGVAGVMNLAAASGEDLATTSDIVTDALTAFNLTAADSNHFADVLATAASNANTNVALMGETFKYVAPTAGALGFSIEDMATAIGLAGNAGIKGSQAGTSLNNLLVRMAKPTNEVVGAMQRLGVWLDDGEGHMYSFREIMEQLRASFKDINMPMEEYTERVAELDASFKKGDLTEAQYVKRLDEITAQTFNAEGAEKARAAAQLAGVRGMTSLLAIVNASEEDWNKLTTAIDGASDVMVKTADGEIMTMEEAMRSGAEVMEEYSGSAEAMAAIMQDNLSGQLTILKSQLQELAISFGDMMVPTIREVVSFLQDLVDKFNQMDDGTREMIIKIALIVAAIGPILSIGGRLISGIGTVISTVGNLVSLVPTLAAGIAALNVPLLPIIAIMAAVVVAGVLLYKNWDTIKEKAGQLKNFLSEKWDNIKAKTSETWNNIKETTSTVMEAVKQNMQERLNNMKDAYEKHGGGLKGTVAALWTGLKDNYKQGFMALNTLTGGKLGEIANAFYNKFNELKNAATNWGKDMIQNLVNGIMSKIQDAANAAGNIANAIKKRLGFSEPETGPLSDFHTYMPDMIDLLTKGIYDNLYKVDAASDAVAGALASGTTNSYNYGGFNIVVNGAEGQSAYELADVIEDRIQAKMAAQKAVWA